jgi:hypothetical protein
MVGQEALGLVSRKAHQEIVTVTAPEDKGAICANTAVSRSMTRPGLFASRSVTSHEVRAPVASLVTVTHVPFARIGLAHWPGFQAYQVARPVACDIDTGAAVVVVVAGATATGRDTVVGAARTTGGALGVETATAGDVVDVVVTGVARGEIRLSVSCRCRSV